MISFYLVIQKMLTFYASLPISQIVKHFYFYLVSLIIQFPIQSIYVMLSLYQYVTRALVFCEIYAIFQVSNMSFYYECPMLRNIILRFQGLASCKKSDLQSILLKSIYVPIQILFHKMYQYQYISKVSDADTFFQNSVEKYWKMY